MLAAIIDTLETEEEVSGMSAKELAASAPVSYRMLATEVKVILDEHRREQEDEAAHKSFIETWHTLTCGAEVKIEMYDSFFDQMGEMRTCTAILTVGSRPDTLPEEELKEALGLFIQQKLWASKRINSPYSPTGRWFGGEHPTVSRIDPVYPEYAVTQRYYLDC